MRSVEIVWAFSTARLAAVIYQPSWAEEGETITWTVT